MQPDSTVVISFSDLLRFLRQGALWALAVAVLAAVAAYFLSQQLEPRYRTQATVVAAQANQGSADFSATPFVAPMLDVSAYREAALSDPTLRAALKSLSAEALGDLGANDIAAGEPGTAATDPQRLADFRAGLTVRTEETQTTGLLYLAAEAPTPEAAAARANAVTEALIAWDRGRARDSLETLIRTLEARIGALTLNPTTPDGNLQETRLSRAQLRTELQEQLFYARALREAATGMLSVIQAAPVPLEPVSPRPLLNAALAGILGVFLVYGLLLMREALDTRLRTTDDLAATSGLSVLAEFPKLPGSARRLPREAAGYLRTNLIFSTADAHPKVLLVTSPQSGEGKSSVALSLAESFARNDYKTLLVDADLRKPVLAGEYNLRGREHVSLRTYLENPFATLEPVQVSVSPSQQLHIIPTFEPAPNPTELLSRGFRDVLEAWRGVYDVIIIDSAPLLPVADTLTIAPLCTGTVLTASVEQTDKKQVRAAVTILSRIGVRVLGVVATQVPKVGRYGSGYGYGYGYGETEPASTPREVAKGRV